MCRSKSVPMTRSISCYYRIGGGERLYLALYRKYRPRTFEDVISQEHITTTLKNQVASGNTAHAYLFTGSRGTGKTTCAKILAMAVNCLSPKDGSPCLECERCKEIMNGESTDIVEMDAASNNGVSDVRQLRDEVAYTPVSCKYRVYIIDEVHMLSIAAFNALLKTLEEPPAHVKFILATTELHKVPATISSRCQRFEFRRVDIDDSAKRLLEVAEKENVSLDKDAAELISRLSDGGMRDALSLLDRCICADEHITSQIVRDCAGVADNRHLFSFSEMTANRDVAGCIRLLSELHKNSKDFILKREGDEFFIYSFLEETKKKKTTINLLEKYKLSNDFFERLKKSTCIDSGESLRVVLSFDGEPKLNDRIINERLQKGECSLFEKFTGEKLL